MSIAPSSPPATAGAPYTLTCEADVPATLGATTTYQWTGGDPQTEVATVATLSFSSLELSDAGLYTCEVTVSSELLGDDDIIENSMEDVTLTSTFLPLFEYLQMSNHVI